MGGLKFFFVVGTRGYWEVILVCLKERRFCTACLFLSLSGLCEYTCMIDEIDL